MDISELNELQKILLYPSFKKEENGKKICIYLSSPKKP